MRHQRTEDRGQRTEVLLPLRGSLLIKERRSRDNVLSSDGTTGHSTRLANNASLVAGYVLCPPSSERGSTLIISLIILIVLMLLGVMAMNTSDTQYKLAGNLQFEDVAMSNAEQAIDAAERWLENDAAIKRATAAANNTVIEASTAVSAVSITPLTMTWTNSETPPNPPSVAVTGPDGTPNDRQRYVIGFVSTTKVPSAPATLVCPNITLNYNCVNTYLITARGQGGRGATKLVQVYYSVPH